MLDQKKLFLLCITFLLAFNAHTLPITDSVVTISIKAVPGLQFDLVRFQVRPRTKVRLILTNTDDMSHNLLITRPGAREEVVNAALQLGEAGPKTDFIPASPKVLWAIPVISPEQSQSIIFTAPEAQGVYPYVCTYPGHGFVMYGAMYVTETPMPSLKDDPHIPASRRTENEKDNANESHAKHNEPETKSWHPYQPVAPYLYRIFMPDATPASMAVHLPGQISYCWDAGTCHLRYAWQGEFLANLDHWKDKGDTFGKLGGVIFYRDKTTYPLRIEKPENIPAVAYKGYRLINRFPEFHYTLNGTDVYELIKPAADGTGLIRTFRIPKANKTVWFVFHPEDGVTYSFSAGKREKDKLKLSARQARHFSITMKKKEGTR